MRKKPDERAFCIGVRRARLSEADGGEVAAGDVGAFHGRQTLARPILLDDDPAGAGLFGGGDDGGHVLHAVADAAELKGAVELSVVFDADQLVQALVGSAVGTEEVLEMDDGGAAAVFEHEGGGVLSPHVDPAGVELRLQKIGGDGLVHQVEAVLSVHFDKLEVVVVVEQLDARFLAEPAEGVDIAQCLGEPLAAGTMRFVTEYTYSTISGRRFRNFARKKMK